MTTPKGLREKVSAILAARGRLHQLENELANEVQGWIATYDVPAADLGAVLSGVVEALRG